MTFVDLHDLYALAAPGPTTRPAQGTVRVLAQASLVVSGFSRGDHFADAALRVAGEQRPDVPAHPRSANLTRHAIRILR
jgi:hypothetical protein